MMENVIAVDPFRCRVWEGHERLEELINEDTCRGEIESVLRHGQMIPVLARPLRGDSNYLYELIYGARRLFVARHLNVQLQAEVREISNREAVIALEIENRHRRELSPYERGRHYRSWLRSGTFASQEELARVLDVSASQVCRLLKLAQLPPVLLSAFASPAEICERWGNRLMQMWEDPERQRRLGVCARELANESPPLPGPVVYQRLMATQVGIKSSPLARIDTNDRDEVIRDDDGLPLFRIRVHRQDVALLLPSAELSDKSLAEIKSQIATILRRSRGPRRMAPRLAAIRFTQAGLTQHSS